MTYYNIGTVLDEKKCADEVEAIYRECVEMGMRVLGDEHPTTLHIALLLGELLGKRGQLDEAEKLLRPVSRRLRANSWPRGCPYPEGKPPA